MFKDMTSDLTYVVPDLEQWKLDHPIHASSLTLRFGKRPSDGTFPSSNAHFNAVALNDNKGILQETYKKKVDNLQQGSFEKTLNLEVLMCKARIALVAKHCDANFPINEASVRMLFF